MAEEMYNNSIEWARRSDDEDPLRNFRDRFLIPKHHNKEQIYFLGNSLGLQSKNTKEEINKILDQWAGYGVEGFFSGEFPWIDYHDLLTKTLSKIIGCLPSEIAVMNQLTVNLHLMLISFYRPRGKRNKILCEAKAFPSDQYVFETHIRSYGLNPGEIIIEVAPRENEHLINTEDILAAIKKHKDELALVLFSGINYYTGQAFDIKTITEAAHHEGIIAGFDLAHAAGNISLQLHDWDVDFACWCSYKYLNSGPGGVGGAYIHERFHHDKNLERFAGWWGYEKKTRFNMEKGFKAIPSAEGWQLSTPSLLLYASHKAALDVFEEAGWENILAKQKKLNNYLWYILDEVCGSSSHGLIEWITPRKENERGSQVSMLLHENGKKIFDQLSAMGVVSDWREPNVIRVAPVPLYNRFEEVWQFGNALMSILKL